jgi:acyl-homoserine-lactone acylase
MQLGDAPIPVPGGTDPEGVIQIATWSAGSGTLLTEGSRAPVVNADSDLTTAGYTMNYGNSFVLAVQYGAEGPEARAVLTYSQSEVAGSPHRDDQTAVYGAEQLRPVLFSAAAIAADPALEELRLTLE